MTLVLLVYTILFRKNQSLSMISSPRKHPFYAQASDLDPVLLDMHIETRLRNSRPALALTVSAVLAKQVNPAITSPLKTQTKCRTIASET